MTRSPTQVVCREKGTVKCSALQRTSMSDSATRKGSGTTVGKGTGILRDSKIVDAWSKTEFATHDGTTAHMNPQWLGLHAKAYTGSSQLKSQHAWGGSREAPPESRSYCNGWLPGTRESVFLGDARDAEFFVLLFKKIACEVGERAGGIEEEFWKRRGWLFKTYCIHVWNSQMIIKEYNHLFPLKSYSCSIWNRSQEGNWTLLFLGLVQMQRLHFTNSEAFYT